MQTLRAPRLAQASVRSIPEGKVDRALPLQTKQLHLRSTTSQGCGFCRIGSGKQPRCNDYLAKNIAKNPKRLKGFATLPLQDPDAAAQELTRCVRDLGFCGALVNGFSEVGEEGAAVYYDLPQYRSFWQQCRSWMYRSTSTLAILYQAGSNVTKAIVGSLGRLGDLLLKHPFTRFV